MELNEEYYQIGKRIERLNQVLPKIKINMEFLYEVLGFAFFSKIQETLDLPYNLRYVERNRKYGLKETSDALFVLEEAALRISMEMNEWTFEIDNVDKSFREKLAAAKDVFVKNFNSESKTFPWDGAQQRGLPNWKTNWTFDDSSSST